MAFFVIFVSFKTRHLVSPVWSSTKANYLTCDRTCENAKCVRIIDPLDVKTFFPVLKKITRTNVQLYKSHGKLQAGNATHKLIPGLYTLERYSLAIVPSHYTLCHCHIAVLFIHMCHNYRYIEVMKYPSV